MYITPKGPFQCKCSQRFGHIFLNCGYSLQCVAYNEANLSGECSTPVHQPKCCSCQRNDTASSQGCVRGSQGGLCKASGSQGEWHIQLSCHAKGESNVPLCGAERPGTYLELCCAWGGVLSLLPHLIQDPLLALSLKVLYRVKWSAPGIWGRL